MDETTKVAVSNPQGVMWTPDQIELIKNTVAKGATNDELKLFLYTASKTGLDPLTKQIHFIKRKDYKNNRDVVSIQTGIDGYRAVAERSGTLAGIDDASYEVNAETSKPNKATVTVYRVVNGTRVPFTASARWSEYAPTGTQAFMWNKMPFLMLGKCAEALALRKAFPNDLSGVYTHEEMQQAENSQITPSSPTPDLPTIHVDQGSPVEEAEVVEYNMDKAAGNILECSEGAEIINQAEYDYSVRFYGRALCREHQKGAQRK